MRKIIIRKPGGVDAMELVTEADPVPGPGEVSVRTDAMAVGWPDILIRTSKFSLLWTIFPVRVAVAVTEGLFVNVGEKRLVVGRFTA